MTAGLRLQNALGLFKLLILLSIVFVGMAHLAGVPGFELKGDVEVPDNLKKAETQGIAQAAMMAAETSPNWDSN